MHGCCIWHGLELRSGLEAINAISPPVGAHRPLHATARLANLIADALK